MVYLAEGKAGLSGRLRRALVSRPPPFSVAYIRRIRLTRHGIARQVGSIPDQAKGKGLFDGKNAGMGNHSERV
jgi:hypothetical protein